MNKIFLVFYIFLMVTPFARAELVEGCNPNLICKQSNNIQVCLMAFQEGVAHYKALELSNAETAFLNVMESCGETLEAKLNANKSLFSIFYKKGYECAPIFLEQSSASGMTRWQIYSELQTE